MLAHGILSSTFGDFKFLMQDSIRDIISGMVRIESFTVGTDITELSHYTQVLFQLFLVHLFKIPGNFRLNILGCVLIKFGQGTKSYTVGKNPKRDISINLPLVIDIRVIAVPVGKIVQCGNQPVNAVCILSVLVVVSRIQVHCLNFTVLFGEVIRK